MLIYFSFNFWQHEENSLQLKIKNGQKPLNYQLKTTKMIKNLDQLKDVSNGRIIMFFVSSDDEHIIIYVFYHFHWYQPENTWF